MNNGAPIPTKAGLRTPGLVGLTLASGLLLALSYSLHPLWWAAWLAPTFATAAITLAPASLRYKLGLLAGTVAGVTTITYHVTVGSWSAALVILGLIAFAWASAFRLTAAILARWSAAAAVLVVPMTWAAIDTLMIHLSPHGSAGSLAYSQMDFLPAIQVASLGVPSRAAWDRHRGRLSQRQPNLFCAPPAPRIACGETARGLG